MKKGEAGINNTKEKRKEVSNYIHLCWDASGIHSISVMLSLELNKNKKPSENYHFVSGHFHG